MKKSVNIMLGILGVSLALAFGASTLMAQDFAKASPQDVKVLLENDRVRVLEVRHQPGVKEPMHSHPAYVSYYLGATRVKVTTPDGKVVEKDRKVGEVQFSGPTTHALENIGATEQHVLVIELKK